MSPVITNPYLLAVETQVALLKLSALQVLKGANVRVTEMFKSHRMAFPRTRTLPPRRITRNGEEKFFASESTECMKLSMIPWCLHWNCHVGGVRVMDGHPTASNAVVLQVTWNSTLRHTDMQSENILFLRLCTLLSWDYLNNSYTDGTPSGESAYVYTYINLCMHVELAISFALQDVVGLKLGVEKTSHWPFGVVCISQFGEWTLCRKISGFKHIDVIRWDP